MAPHLTETVTIINKSGKVVSTGKQLVNIFKDAKAAYQEKKAQLREEYYLREEARSHRAQRRLNEARYDIADARGDDAQSVASSRPSHRSHPPHRSHSSRQEPESHSRLTINNHEEFPDTQSMASARSHRSYRSHTRTRREFNFHDLDEEEDMQSLGSKRSHRSRRSKRRRSVHGSKAPTQSEPAGTHYEDPEEGLYDDPLPMYRQPFAETELTLARPNAAMESPPMPGHLVRRDTAPPSLSSSQLVPRSRSTSVPDIHDETIDMNLAYGDLPPQLESDHESEYEHQPTPQLPAELDETMTKLDTLLIEAECLHHTATAIMTNLQTKPEAMAAVALTLAELSSLLTRMSPSIIPMLRASSPAIFALLVSPQFLIAGGVALGVTVVMFNGYKIIKKLQAAPEKKLEAPIAMPALPSTPGYPETPGFMHPRDMHHEYEEAMPCESYQEELSSIDVWRRGIADAELESVGTSVDGEYITPTAARQKESRHAERIRQRAAEERIDEDEAETRSLMTRLTNKSRRSKTFPIRRSSSQHEPDIKEHDDVDALRHASKPSKSTKSSRTHKSSRPKKDDDGASITSGRTEKAERSERDGKESQEKKKKTPLSIFRSRTEKSSHKGKEKEGKKMSHHPLLLEI